MVQKLNQLNQLGVLIIRAIIFKNKAVMYNHKYQIKGRENVSFATISVTTVLCSWYFKHAARGDTLDCFLGAGHKGVLVSKTRNIHLSRFIGILNKIKAKIGIYPIISPTKQNWYEFLAGEISNDVLEVLPTKKVIIPAIKDHLVEIWCKEWSQLSGHRQTKFWFTKPDPILAVKLLNMTREDLGKCIQFLSGHDWWQKHLSITKLSDNPQCRLCEEEGCEETPIHIFTECEALASARLALFGVYCPISNPGGW